MINESALRHLKRNEQAILTWLRQMADDEAVSMHLLAALLETAGELHPHGEAILITGILLGLDLICLESDRTLGDCHARDTMARILNANTFAVLQKGE